MGLQKVVFNERLSLPKENFNKLYFTFYSRIYDATFSQNGYR